MLTVSSEYSGGDYRLPEVLGAGAPMLFPAGGGPPGPPFTGIWPGAAEPVREPNKLWLQPNSNQHGLQRANDTKHSPYGRDNRAPLTLATLHVAVLVHPPAVHTVRTPTVGGHAAA